MRFAIIHYLFGITLIVGYQSANAVTASSACTDIKDFRSDIKPGCIGGAKKIALRALGGSQRGSEICLINVQDRLWCSRSIVPEWLGEVTDFSVESFEDKGCAIDKSLGPVCWSWKTGGKISLQKRFNENYVQILLGSTVIGVTESGKVDPFSTLDSRREFRLQKFNQSAPAKDISLFRSGFSAILQDGRPFKLIFSGSVDGDMPNDIRPPAVTSVVQYCFFDDKGRKAEGTDFDGKPLSYCYGPLSHIQPNEALESRAVYSYGFLANDWDSLDFICGIWKSGEAYCRGGYQAPTIPKGVIALSNVDAFQRSREACVATHAGIQCFYMSGMSITIPY